MNVIRAHDLRTKAPANQSLGLLTLAETSRELRCSRKRLNDIMQGRVADLPPLPAFHIGSRPFIRRAQLCAWIRTLEDKERERAFATGNFGLRDEEWELIAGA